MYEVNVTNSCINGKCSRCGECCTDFIPLTKHEIRTILNYLKEHPEIQEQYKNTNKEYFDVRCAFLDEHEHKCLIYPVRPDICRTFQCNKHPKILTLNKEKHFAKAYINRPCPQSEYLQTDKVASTHSIFFNNKQWDLNFISAYAKSLCKNNINLFKDIVKDMSKYFVYREGE